MRHHPMPATTHTVEMRQAADLNERLRTDTAITAGRLGLHQVNCRSGGQLSRLPATAELVQVAWDGPAGFPNLYGTFRRRRRVRRPGRQGGSKLTWIVEPSPPPARAMLPGDLGVRLTTDRGSHESPRWPPAGGANVR